MAIPMNKGAFPYQLDRTIKKMWAGEYSFKPTEYDKVAQIKDFGDGASFSEAEISPLGGLVSMGENSPIPFDTPVEGHKKTWTTVKFGRGFAVTKEMIEDNLFGKAVDSAKSLARSAVYCAETAFWNNFNLGFSTALSWDALSVFNDSHVTLKSVTTIDNNVSADLSQTSLEAAFQYVDGLVDEAGMKLMLTPDKLIVGPSLRELAFGLKTSLARVWAYSNWNTGQINSNAQVAPGLSADGIKNFLNPANGQVPDWTPFVCHYLTDANSWFLTTKEIDVRFLWKRKPSIESADDFNTETKMYKTTMRFSTGWGDYKGVYGSAGAS
jgi:hypothetical protein